MMTVAQIRELRYGVVMKKQVLLIVTKTMKLIHVIK